MNKHYLNEVGLPLGAAFIVMVASPLRLSSTWVEEAGSRRKNGPPETDAQGRQLYELDVFRLKESFGEVRGSIETVLVPNVASGVDVGDFIEFEGLSASPTARSWNLRAEAATILNDVIDLDG